jgi:hypothetical protein
MSERTSRLGSGRLVLEAALLRAATALTDMGENTPIAEIAALAAHVTALQLAAEALERAIAIGERYQPTYFGEP